MCFKFYKDAIMFVLLLFAMASVGMVFTLYLYIKRHVSLRETIIRALDIVTIAVPPALPAAMTVATVYAQNRLKRANIFCISPHRINVGGKLKLVCFDKTGTLTEEGLDLWGILPVHNRFFMAPVGDPTQLPARSPLLVSMATCHTLTTVDGKLVGDPVDLSMFRATKWDIEEPGAASNRYDVLTPTVVKPPPARKARLAFLHQTPLVFIPPQLLTESTGRGPAAQATDVTTKPGDSEDVEIEEVPYEVGIVRQFPFTSTLQRMSVVCRTLGRRYMDLYAKGAPEMIHSLCDPATVPENYFDVLRGYTLQGFRVMALAYRPLEKKLTWHHVQRVGRDQVECNLTFLGFLIMQNMLKLESTPVIHTLHNACIRCLMVTGDNLWTAISVARDCDMIASTVRVVVVKASINPGSSMATLEFEEACRADEISSNRSFRADKYIEMEENSNFQFAVDGRSFAIIRHHFPDIFEKLLVRGTVFARMLPDQKMQLVQHLQQLGYVVGMCGDGANDCGALKAADVGISLSEAESSVAAPFTSKVPNIQCVAHCNQGRTLCLGHFILHVQVHLIVQSHPVSLRDAALLRADQLLRWHVSLCRLVCHHNACSDNELRRALHRAGGWSSPEQPRQPVQHHIAASSADHCHRWPSGNCSSTYSHSPGTPVPNHDPEEDVYKLLGHGNPVLRLLLPVPHHGGGFLHRTTIPEAPVEQLLVPGKLGCAVLLYHIPAVPGIPICERSSLIWCAGDQRRKLHFRMTILMVCGLSWIFSHVVEELCYKRVPCSSGRTGPWYPSQLPKTGTRLLNSRSSKTRAGSPPTTTTAQAL
uniref:Putative cation-transporting atpase n=1 Tax=Ixodes ricinus TaxID=34613 RepID=A0A090X9V6_IXORI